MAKALIGGFTARTACDVQRIIAYDPNSAALDELRAICSQCEIATSPDEVARQADLVFLAVKPQRVVDALSPLLACARSFCLVSMAAGYCIHRLAELSGTQRVVRIMPNTPALVGHSATAVAFGSAATPEDRHQTLNLMRQVGTVVEVPEPLLDAVTGLSGSGPAYVLTFVQALIDGGVLAGLPCDIARELAIQTVAGTIELIRKSDASLLDLRDQVTSPGGTTMCGLQVLEAGSFETIISDAIQAATRRAQELAAD